MTEGSDITLRQQRKIRARQDEVLDSQEQRLAFDSQMNGQKELTIMLDYRWTLRITRENHVRSVTLIFSKPLTKEIVRNCVEIGFGVKIEKPIQKKEA